MYTAYLGGMTDVGNMAALNSVYTPEGSPSLRQSMGLNQGGFLRRSAVDMIGALQQSGSALLDSGQARAAEAAQRIRLNMPQMQMPGMGMATAATSAPASSGGGGSEGGGGGNKGTGGGNQGGGNKDGGGKGNQGKRPPTGGRNALMSRNMLLGGALAAGAVPGVMEMQQGNTVGGAAQAAVGGGTAALGASMMQRGNPKSMLIGATVAGLGQLASGFIGDRAQVAAAEATGATSSEEEAAQKAGRTSRRKDAEIDLLINQGILDQNLSAIKDLSRFNADLEREYMIKNMPMIEKMKRNELVRNQAMAATLTSNYAMLGAQATAGKLAVGAQQQMGANFRTALTNNPYAGNTMQAPNISF